MFLKQLKQETVLKMIHRGGDNSCVEQMVNGTKGQ